MGKGFVIIDTTGFPIGFLYKLDSYLELLEGLGMTVELDDDGIHRLYNPSHDLLARIHELTIGF